MEAETLVRMANQIALFFAPYPEADAIDGVRDHLMKFWDPAMRKELVAIDSALIPTTATLHPLVVRAVRAMQRSGHE